jgi:hypothetical protein
MRQIADRRLRGGGKAMSARTAAHVAWSLCAITIASVGIGLLLLAMSGSTAPPGTGGDPLLDLAFVFGSAWVAPALDVDLETGPFGAVETLAWPIVVVGLPVSIGIAILRYRLYDVDLLINRTLVYGVLTASIAAIYFGSVVLFQQFFRDLTGQRSDLAIVGSTLVIAALFQPLRPRIQALIDRRFYRRRYDAAKVLTAFGTASRDEVDLARLTDRLVEAVEETMRPASVSLWLRTPETVARAAERPVGKAKR